MELFASTKSIVKLVTNTFNIFYNKMAFNKRSYTSEPEQIEYNKAIKRVYVNPNFNKVFSANDQCVKELNTVMHINRNFPHNTNTQNKKIFINPNFLSSANQEHSSIQMKCDIHSNERVLQENLNNIPSNAMNSINCIPLPQEYKAQTVQPATVKSRYCLIRNVEHKPSATRPDKTETVKLSKYKSVRLKDIKRNLDSVKPIDKLPIKMTQTKSQKLIQKCNNLSPVILKTQFKFIKRNAEPVKTMILKSPLLKTTPADFIVKNKLKSDIQRKIKMIRGNLKKNNIPCPLFRKYGKCLRNSRGNCQYLHDKKHVSICRKFLKGICHDKTCLLSHELTAKKMPTCYFYLQGMCNKDDCPYLHVKLNEKTKVCADFTKGYCEKGEKCLNRHVNIRNVTIKQAVVKKQCNSSSLNKGKSVKWVKVKDPNDKTNIECNIEVKNESNVDLPANHEKNEHITDCRYYKESSVDTSSGDAYEVIKPTRCKLGTLPSFIKL